MDDVRPACFVRSELSSKSCVLIPETCNRSFACGEDMPQGNPLELDSYVWSMAIVPDGLTRWNPAMADAAMYHTVP